MPRFLNFFLALHILVLYQTLDAKNEDIPILADLGEPGTPYIGEVERPKRKRLDVIHGADPNRPADRHPKYSLPERLSKANRRALCARLCAMTTKSISANPEDAGTETKEPLMLMGYSEYRAITRQAPDVADSETPFPLENCS